MTMDNKMDIRDFLLLAYNAFNDEFSGKTTMQKKIYFLGVILNYAEELGFKPHYYGPYSAKVNEANEILKSLGFVSEMINSAGIVNDQGFEIIKYYYRLTESGKRIVQKKIVNNSSEWNQINNAAEQINQGGNIDYKRLSIAAKEYFILSKNNREVSLSDVKEMASHLGWSVSGEELQDATDFLEKISLAKRV